MVIYVSEETVETLGLNGQFTSFPIEDIDSVYVFNIIENPFAQFDIDPRALKRLKAIYLDDSTQPQTIAFPVRFIEDLVLFYSIDGKSPVHRLEDIFKLRPAPASALGIHRTANSRNPGFEFTDQAAHCASPPPSPQAIKPTRVLADKISIAEFFGSFEQGYEAIDSFQERTYLYAKPFLYEPKTRLGLSFKGSGEEPAINLPLYFQWATGTPYRFQSFNVVGSKAHEFTPNTEPFFGVRTDVKSHAFHALFIGNAAGLSAGTGVFLGSNSVLDMKGQVTVQPTFNYMALMGADYGPYSVSGGFYFPTFGIKVRDEYREILGSSASYALRTMYTRRDFRLRALGSLTSYSQGRPTKKDLLARTGNSGSAESVNSYRFNALFLRAGVDYDLSKQLRLSLDGVYVGGDYKESRTYLNPNGTFGSDIRFKKITTQFQVRQSFGDYIAISGYLNLNQNFYESNFINTDLDKEQKETQFFGSLEFIF